MGGLPISHPRPKPDLGDITWAMQYVILPFLDSRTISLLSCVSPRMMWSCAVYASGFSHAEGFPSSSAEKAFDRLGITYVLANCADHQLWAVCGGLHRLPSSGVRPIRVAKRLPPHVALPFQIRFVRETLCHLCILGFVRCLMLMMISVNTGVLTSGLLRVQAPTKSIHVSMGRAMGRLQDGVCRWRGPDGTPNICRLTRLGMARMLRGFAQSFSRELFGCAPITADVTTRRIYQGYETVAAADFARDLEWTVHMKDFTWDGNPPTDVPSLLEWLGADLRPPVAEGDRDSVHDLLTPAAFAATQVAIEMAEHPEEAL